MRLRKAIVYSASALVLLLIVLAAVLYSSADRILNSDRVRSKIYSILSQAVSGNAGYDRLDLRFFPIPRFAITGLKISYPGGGARAEEVILQPHLVSLFRGEFRISSLSIRKPSIEITLPEEKETPFDPAEIERKVIPVFQAISQYATGLQLEIRSGDLKLLRSGPGEGPWLFQNADLTLALSTGLDLALRCGSSPWGPLAFKGRFNYREAMLQVDRAQVSVGGSSLSEISARLEWSGPLSLKAQAGKSVLKLDEIETLTERRIAEVFPTLKAINGTALLTSASFNGPLENRGEWRYTAAGSVKDLVFRENRIPEPIRIISAEYSTDQDSLSLRNADARFMDSAFKLDATLAYGQFILEKLSFSGTIGRKSIRSLSEKAPFLRGLEFPSDIAVKGGFAYRPGIVEVRNLDFSTGRSSVSNLSGSLELVGRNHLKVGADRLVIIPGEFGEQGLRILKRIIPDLNRISGIFTFTSFSLDGDPRDAKGWRYSASGSIQNGLLETDSLPGTLQVAVAGFQADEGRFSLEGARAAFLDSDLSGSGSVRIDRGKAEAVEMQFAGRMGEQSVQWASGRLKLPEQAVLPRSLDVQGARFAWTGAGLLALSGTFDLRPAGNAGPLRLALEFGRSPEAVTIRKGYVKDNLSDASFAFDYGKDRVAAFTFSGSLHKGTLDSLYRIDQPEAAWISGKLSGRIPVERPRSLTATGTLTAGHLQLPIGERGPVRIESLDLRAERDHIQIRNSNLAWQGHVLSVQGTARNYSGQGRTRVDADIRTGTIDVDALTKVFAAPKTAAEANPSRLPFGWVSELPVEGAVRIKADRVVRGQLALEPAAAEFSIQRDRVRIFVERALLCSVPVPGTIEIKPGGLLFTARSEFKNLPIAPILKCLTGERMGLTGSATFRSELEGTDRISESLWGDGELVIRDGRIYRFGLLSRILEFLNITQIVLGDIPDLGRKGMAYDVIRIRYRLEGSRLILSRIILRGPTLAIAGDGSIDLARNTINLTLLVTPLRTVDKILSRIPIVRNFRGILGIPVSVYGRPDSPIIVPLSPGAVGAHIFELMKEVIQLPFSLF